MSLNKLYFELKAKSDDLFIARECIKNKLDKSQEDNDQIRYLEQEVLVVMRKLANLSMLLLAMFMIVSCGSDDSKKASNETTKESEKPSVITAMALDSRDDLPSCDPDVNLKQLVYIKSDREFASCEDSGEWEAIDLPEIETVRIESSNELWTDPVNGKRFLLGAKVDRSNVSCGAGFRIPTRDEAYGAVLRGVANSISGNHGVWIDPSDPVTAEAYLLQTGATTSPFAVAAYMLCVKS